MSPPRRYFEPLLPFPLRRVETDLGPVEVYDIPENQKGPVLEKLYPFRPIPKLETLMEDIHAEKTFRVKEFMVTREEGMNVLASPYYLEGERSSTGSRLQGKKSID